MHQHLITRVSTVAAPAGVVSSAVGPDAVLLDTRSGAYYGLNALGSRIWGAIAQPIGVGDLCDRLAADYDVPRDQISREIIEFLFELCAAGLVALNPDHAMPHDPACAWSEPSIRFSPDPSPGPSRDPCSRPSSGPSSVDAVTPLGR